MRVWAREVSKDKFASFAMDGRQLCFFYAQTGTCRYGDMCRFSHEVKQGARGALEPPQRYQGRDIQNESSRFISGPGASPSYNKQAAHRRPHHRFNCAEPRFHDRCWVQAPQVVQHQPSNRKTWSLRVMSYNILADELAMMHSAELYPRTPFRLLSWQHRWPLIRKEIKTWRPDVLCLQEVDHYSQIREALSALGYEGAYVKRTGGRNDGCATFWRTSRVEAEHVQPLYYNDYNLKDNVALMVMLRPRRCSKEGDLRADNDHRHPDAARDKLRKDRSRRNNQSAVHGRSVRTELYKNRSGSEGASFDSGTSVLPSPNDSITSTESSHSSLVGQKLEKKR